jgi:hypothetical protein
MNVLKNAIRLASLSLALVATGSWVHGATLELSQPYTPSGAAYSITALQGINPASPQSSGTSIGANPNLNFEFQTGIGVNYTAPNNKKTDFGIGLYDGSTAAGTQATSTGLHINFNQLETSNGLTVTLGDFDVTTPSGLFNQDKVAPTLTIYGAGNVVLGEFSAAQLIPDMTLISAIDPITKVDTWSLNIGALLPANTAVQGYTLAADLTNGKGTAEHVPSDPYFIANVGTTTPVPEPGSAVLLGVLAGGFMLRRRR